MSKDVETLFSFLNTDIVTVPTFVILYLPPSRNDDYSTLKTNNLSKLVRRLKFF